MAEIRVTQIEFQILTTGEDTPYETSTDSDSADHNDDIVITVTSGMTLS